jgi:hypothetical protein
MQTISIIIEVKAKNGEDTHVCNLALSGPMNEALELLETLVKEEFERADSRINHLSIRQTNLVHG